MDKVAIITDTVSHITPEIARQHNVRVISLHITIDGKTYPESEVDLAWFYEQMPGWKQENRLPVTSSPSAGDFLELYRTLSREAEAILYVGYSPRLGMAIDSAVKARAMAERELPGTPIEIVGSLTACGAQMMVVLEAARAAARGATLAEVLAVANNMLKKVNFIYLSDDLSYLAKGGRIHRARPWASSKVTNTVLLEMDAATGGENTPLARCRTKGQVLATLFNIVKERSQGKKLHVGINHADALVEAEELKEKTLQQFPCAEIYITPILPVVTTHTGLGSRWFCWWSED
jgi:DegV family protein with EDD domain